jgi:hypothetical protein
VFSSYLIDIAPSFPTKEVRKKPGTVQGVDSGVFEAVARTLEGQDLGMVHDPVDHRCGDDLVTEDVAPTGERQVGGQDQRGVFVAAGDQLEEQVRGVLFERDISDLVDDEQTDAPQFGQFSRKPASIVGGFESGHPVHGGGESDAMPGLGGFDRQSDGQVGFAGTGRSQ